MEGKVELDLKDFLSLKEDKDHAVKLQEESHKQFLEMVKIITCLKMYEIDNMSTKFVDHIVTIQDHTIEIKINGRIHKIGEGKKIIKIGNSYGRN